MNMSSVASEICLLPSRTFARTASIILSFGMSICGLRSGTQNWQRRPQPVVISTTPNVVRLSGNRISLRSFGCATSICFGRSSPASAWSNSLLTSADSLRPSTTQSTLSLSHELVWVICQPPDPPTMTLNPLRWGFDLIASNNSIEQCELIGGFDDPEIEVYTPAAKLTPSGLCVATATIRVSGPTNFSRSAG